MVLVSDVLKASTISFESAKHDDGEVPASLRVVFENLHCSAHPFAKPRGGLTGAQTWNILRWTGAIGIRIVSRAVGHSTVRRQGTWNNPGWSCLPPATEGSRPHECGGRRTCLR